MERLPSNVFALDMIHATFQNPLVITTFCARSENFRSENMVRAKKTIPKVRVPRGEMRPLTPREVRTLESILFNKKQWRDLALFRLGIDSMLRASDLVRLLIDEIVDGNGKVLPRAEVIMKKTKRRVRFVISDQTAEAIELWLQQRPSFAGEWLFPGREPGTHLTEQMYRKRAKQWFRSIGLDVKHYSTHSMRRTKASEVYRQTKNLEVVRQLLGHTDIWQTSRYLGVSEAEALEVAKEVRI